jgi:hypothetical protein
MVMVVKLGINNGSFGSPTGVVFGTFQVLYIQVNILVD